MSSNHLHSEFATRKFGFVSQNVMVSQMGYFFGFKVLDVEFFLTKILFLTKSLKSLKAAVSFEI